jgi:dihydroflavonol-4-reductase
MRAFVTGATGFIGRRLVERLVGLGETVTALVRDQAQELPTRVAPVAGRLEDGPDKLAAGMADCDVVFHLAAMVTFDPRRLPELVRVNAEGTRTVLSAAAKAGVARTVFVSSACTMGLSHRATDILSEDAPLDPSLEQRNPYMRSKRLAEAYAIEAADAGQAVTIVNPTTVFGPGDRTLNSGTLVRQVAQAAAMPVPPGGSNVIDVDDVVDGILAAAQHGLAGRRYILGGANLTFREILEQIAAVVGRRPLLVPLPGVARLPMTAAAWLVQRATGSRLITPQIVGDTFAYKFYSSKLAESELGWRARRSFTSTLSAAWDYYRRENLIPLPVGATAA